MKKDNLKLVNKIVLIVFRITLIVTAIVLLMMNQPKQITILCITFLLTFYEVVLEKVIHLKLPFPLQIILTLFIVATQYLGSVLDFYGIFYWWDTAVHTISGGVFLYMGILLLDKLNKEKTAVNPSIIILFGIFFALSIGVVWEIFEYAVDSFLNGNMQRTLNEVGHAAVTDTMVDLMAATSGAIITGAFEFYRRKQRKKEISE